MITGESIPTSFMSIPGKGLEANFEGIEVLIGNRRLMAENNIDIESKEQDMLRLEEEGKTAIRLSHKTMKTIKQNLF